MTQFRTLDDADLHGKRVLVRVDLNVPTEGGRVTDRTRIARILPTIREISDKGGRAVLLAHFGRPKGGPDEKNSLKPIAAALAEELGRPVAFVPATVGDIAHSAIGSMRDGDVVLLENTRFHAGEEKNEAAFVEQLAALGDIFVNDAFSAAHRAHASTEGLARRLPSHAGRTMQAELAALARALELPERPVVAVVGGAKVSTKLELLGNLVKRVDVLVIVGGMANTFLAAQGVAVGKSLCEHDLLDTARDILAGAGDCRVVLPVDAVVASEFRAHAPSKTVSVDDVGPGDMILDIGPRSVAAVKAVLEGAKTLVWNGPFGAFEMQPFDAGTVAVAQEAAAMTLNGSLVSVAGGGDTVAALNAAGAADGFTYVSTAGGAFLEWMEGKVLPGVEALRL